MERMDKLITLLRALLYVVLGLWLGAEAFLPFVAATVFHTLAPDTHTAGRIVGTLLTMLHEAGIAIIVAVLVLLLAGIVYPRTRVLPSVVTLAVALLLTLTSQFYITPAMERDRQAAGGDVHSVSADHPARIHFEKLHQQSEKTEGAILVMAAATLALLTRSEDESRHSTNDAAV